MHIEPGQKDYIKACYLANGTKEGTIRDYTTMDELGYAPRESNVQPLDSRAYATILWHTAVKLGWFV